MPRFLLLKTRSLSAGGRGDGEEEENLKNREWKEDRWGRGGGGVKKERRGGMEN